jgi:hypothetical protein
MSASGPKKLLLERLSARYEVKPLRGSDVLALNSVSTLYVRYNKNAGGGPSRLARFWFGVTQGEYDRYREANLFVVCICAVTPSDMDYVVFPAEVFDEIKKVIPLRAGQWKFNLQKELDGKYTLLVTGGGRYDVSDFLNYFDFAPRDFARGSQPVLREYQPPARIQEPAALPAESRPLALELLDSSKDSGNPKRFESALARLFRELGFVCREIGGAGETDVLVEQPVRFIVDGKSTKVGAKSSVNFTRMKRHMKENSAGFLVIASVAFDPAVARDAEMEGATLVPVESLVGLLDVHQRYALAPSVYADAFRKPGLMDGKAVQSLHEVGAGFELSIVRTLLLLEALDFTPRTADEVKGRLDLLSQQRGQPAYDKAELEAGLSLIASPIVGVVEKTSAGCRLAYAPAAARDRLRVVLRAFCR